MLIRSTTAAYSNPVTLFFKGPNFCTKFYPLNDFLNGELHIILKSINVKNLRAFDFCSIIEQKYV